jgi:hypothetical protein
MKSGCICRVVVELKDEEKVVQSMAIIWVGPQGRDNTIGFLFQ